MTRKSIAQEKVIEKCFLKKKILDLSLSVLRVCALLAKSLWQKPAVCVCENKGWGGGGSTDTNTDTDIWNWKTFAVSVSQVKQSVK